MKRERKEKGSAKGFGECRGEKRRWEKEGRGRGAVRRRMEGQEREGNWRREKIGSCGR